MPTSPWAALEPLEAVQDLQQEESIKLPAAFHIKEYSYICQQKISGQT